MDGDLVGFAPPLANEAGSRFEAASSGERSGLIGGERGGKPAQMRPGARFQAAVRPFLKLVSQNRDQHLPAQPGWGRIADQFLP